MHFAKKKEKKTPQNSDPKKAENINKRNKKLKLDSQTNGATCRLHFFLSKGSKCTTTRPPIPQINIQTAAAPRHAHLVFFPIGKHSRSNDGSWQLLAGPISNLWRATATASRNSQTPPPASQAVPWSSTGAKLKHV